MHDASGFGAVLQPELEDVLMLEEFELADAPPHTPGCAVCAAAHVNSPGKKFPSAVVQAVGVITPIQ